jgi:integrase
VSDPIEQRKAALAAARLEASKSVTFETAVENYIEAHRNSWRTKKHEAQLRSMMNSYAYPIIGRLPVAAIEDEHVRQILAPIWHTKMETARRVRGHLEAVLERETHLKQRKGDSPARLGMVKTALGKQASMVRHMPALPYSEIGAFMEALKAQDGIGAVVLQFTILTAARTSETIGAKLDEFDLNNAIWTIPADRMKSQKEHREPLSTPALEIVNEMAETPGSEYLFPGGRKGRPLSNMAMLMTLDRMGRRDITVHGFRSWFRDWAAEQTSFAREVAEAALAHTIPDAVEAAYRRGDLFEKRRRLMADWADYCGTVKQAGKVIPIRQRK